MVLGIDLGTASVKVALMNPDGELVARASAGYGVTSRLPGWAESNPDAWWTAVVSAVRAAVDDHRTTVEAVGLSGQMHGVVMVDDHGRHLRDAILWPDRRSVDALARFRALSAVQRARLGNPLTPGTAGPILCWLRDHERPVYDEAASALQPKDWLRSQLTGVRGTDPSDASATLLFDIQTESWAHDVVDSLGLSVDLLAPISPSMTVGGTLTSLAADTLGLRPGLPVSVGAGDTAAALVGTGAASVPIAQLSIGSGGQIVVPLDSAIVDQGLRTNLFRSAEQQGWYAMAAMQNVGTALEQTWHWLGVTWDEAYRLLSASPPGANEVTFVPYLTGERTPFFDHGLRGRWVNLSLAHTRADVVRAAFEGVAFGIRLGLDALHRAGHGVEAARLTGGGAIEGAWRQLLSDVLGITIEPSPVDNASARGAAVVGALATGWSAVEVPLPRHRSCIEPGLDRYAYEMAYERFVREISDPLGSIPIDSDPTEDSFRV